MHLEWVFIKTILDKLFMMISLLPLQGICKRLEGRREMENSLLLLYCIVQFYVEQTFYVTMKDFPEEPDIQFAYQSAYSRSTARNNNSNFKLLERSLNQQETIELFKEIKQRNGRKFKTYTMIQNEKCIREQLLHYFDQRLIEKPYHCCSKCKMDAANILQKRTEEKNSQEELNWKKRLNLLLPT